MFEFKTVYCCVMYIMGNELHSTVDDCPGFLPSDDDAEREKHRKSTKGFVFTPCCTVSACGLASGASQAVNTQVNLTFRSVPSHSMLRGLGRTHCVLKTLDNPHESDVHHHSHYMTYIQI